MFRVNATQRTHAKQRYDDWSRAVFACVSVCVRACVRVRKQQPVIPASQPTCTTATTWSINGRTMAS